MISHRENRTTGPDLQGAPERRADDVTRALPHALGPEKSILSTMLQDPQEFIGLAIEEKLSADHFYLPAHATLFAFVVGLFSGGKEIELVSLIQHLLDNGQLDRIGGPSALTDLYTYAPSPGHFLHHLRHVKDKYVLRQMLALSDRTLTAVYDSPGEAAELLEEMEREVMAIRDELEVERPQTIKESVNAVIENFQRRLRGGKDARGISTGFEELDRMTGGLKPGDMFVIGARPSMGKTSAMMNIVEHVCITEGVPALVFSAEMSHDQIVERLVFSRARYAQSGLTRGAVPNKGDLLRIQRAAVETSGAKLYIDDTAGPTINFIRAKARRCKREHKIGLIAIDYLQLLKSVSKQAMGSREREISEISAGVKGLAKDLGIPIIILAQLNRESEKRGGKAAGKPRMSDLRDSGSIEQDADIVGLLHRPAYYAETPEEKEAMAGEAQLDLAKNRNGETGIVPLTFIAELMRFESGPPSRESGGTPEPPARRSRFA